MLARATILAGAPQSPVVLHVPACPPTSTTDADYLPGRHAASPTALVVRAIRHHAQLCPHAILNRGPQNVISPPRPDLDRIPDRDYSRVCAKHARVTDAFRAPSDPYRQLVNDIVAERLDSTNGAVVIELHMTLAGAIQPTQIVLGVDDYQTPDTLIDAAASVFRDFDVMKSAMPENPKPEDKTDPRVQRISITFPLYSHLSTSTSYVDQLGLALAALCDATVDQLMTPATPVVHPALGLGQ